MTSTGRLGTPILDGTQTAVAAARVAARSAARSAPHSMKAKSKSIIGLLVSAAVLAVLLTGCSDEPDPIPSDGTDSSPTTSSEQGFNPEPTHAPTSALTNTPVPEAATPTDAPTAAAPGNGSAGEFASVSAGWFHSCGVRTDGSVECWGVNVDWEGNVVGQATPPGSSFTSVSAGWFHSCGVRTDGSVECWGNNDFGQADPPNPRVKG